MPRVPRISGAEAVRVFEKAGWQFQRQHGSHTILHREGHGEILSIPQHRELGVGLLQVQIKKAGLTVEEFIALLSAALDVGGEGSLCFRGGITP